MQIDINKVNLTERDIEDWLYANPQEIDSDNLYGPIVKWFGRQYPLPSGIADLIGVCSNGALVVIEVKNVPINKAAVLQVCRYSADMQQIASFRMDYPIKSGDGQPYVQRFLVGPSIDDQTFSEALACDVRVIQFSAHLNLDLGTLRWGRTHRGEIEERWSAISRKVEWGAYGLHIDDDIAQRLADETLANEVDSIVHAVWDSSSRNSTDSGSTDSIEE